MKMKIFSMYDTKLEGFMRPFFLQTEAVAVRAIIDLAKDPAEQTSKHPEDFVLYELGTFEDHSAVIDQLVPPRRIGLVSEMVRNYSVESIVPGESRGETAVSNEAPVLRRAARGDSAK